VQGAHQVFGINRFCNDAVATLGFQQETKAKPDDRMVVCDRDTGYHGKFSWNLQRRSTACY